MIKRKFDSTYLKPELHIKLYEACVKPILLYCSEIWTPYILKFDKYLNKTNNNNILEEMYENLPSEKIQSKFAKMILGCHRTSNNIAARAELGIFPLTITILPLMVKYWLKLNINPLDKLVFFTLNEDKHNYNCMIKLFLEYIGYNHVYMNKNTFSVTTTVKSIKVALQSRYISFINKTMDRHDSKLRTYKLYKNNYKLESYLKLPLPKEDIKTFSRFRISNHNLEIEVGRHSSKDKQKVAAEYRFCKKCHTNQVEDETHFLLVCNKYKNDRDIFLHKIETLHPNSTDKSTKDLFLYLMNNTETYILIQLVKFVKKCFEIRNNII